MGNRRSQAKSSDEESSFLNEEEYKECPICHQEFADGVCPIASGECPYVAEGEEEEDDEEHDFEDVENLKEVLVDDKEADKLTDVEGDVPEEDLKDEEP